jgi:hypothetical protein
VAVVVTAVVGIDAAIIVGVTTVDETTVVYAAV